MKKVSRVRTIPLERDQKSMAKSYRYLLRAIIALQVDYTSRQRL